MKNILKGTVAVIVTLVLVGIFMQTHTSKENLGFSDTGVAARLDLATTTTVGPEAQPRNRIFSRTSQCDARVISTRGDSAIMIAFGEYPDVPGNLSSTTLSGSFGHLQLASTTVVYDGGQYGCDNWYAFGFSTTTITVSSF